MISKFYYPILAALILIAHSVSAQSYIKGRTYNITTNTTISGPEFPDHCDACVFNIAADATLTVNKPIAIPDAIINGGNMQVNKEVSFWSAGQFNNVKVSFGNSGAITSSAKLAINNSEFIFNGSAKGTFWAQVDMNNSKIKLLDNASVEITKTFVLANSSSMVAGDGSAKSTAFINFDGGSLVQKDNSYVTLMSYNNYYHNWKTFTAEGKTYKTTDNKMNCGGTGQNTCNSPFLYGPATLNFAGVASSAILPVKLSSFTVDLSGVQVAINWTAAVEVNFDRYEIERSTDGQSWIAIGTVKPANSTSFASRYTFTDILKAASSFQYRLKMIDIDGTVAYSPVKAVRSGQNTNVEMTIFPNPATDYVVVDTRNSTDKISVQLFNLNGVTLKKVSGTGKQTLPVTGLTPGTYVVQAIIADGSSKSFILAVK